MKSVKSETSRTKNSSNPSIPRGGATLPLPYLGGRLAAQYKDTLRTIYTGRALTVRNVRDNLRYARLHMARTFKPGAFKTLATSKTQPFKNTCTRYSSN